MRKKPMIRKFLVLSVFLLQISFGQNAKIILPSGHTGYITSLSFSPDGSILASGAGVDEDAVLIWDVKTGREVGSFPTDDADHITFSHSGNFLAAGGMGGIHLWDITTGETKPLQEGRGWIYSIAFTSDSKFVASGLDPAGQEYMHKIQIRSVASGQIIESFSGKIKAVCSMVFSPTDSILATSGSYEDPDIIELWNPWTGKLLKTFTKSGGKLIFSTDGKNLIACSEKNGLNVFKMPEGQLIYSGAYIGYLIGFTKLGEIIADKNNGKTATFFDLAAKKITRVLHFAAWNRFVYDSNQNVFASIAARGKIVLRDADNSNVFYTFGETCPTCGRINRVRDILVNSVDASLSIQTYDSMFHVLSFSLNKFQTMKQLPKKWKTVGSIPSPRQRKLLKELNESQMDNSPREESYFSSSSKYIAFALGYNISILNVDSEQTVQSFSTNAYYPKCAFSADSRKLIINSQVGLTLLDIESGKELGNLVSLADFDWVFVTPEGLYDGTGEGIKYPHGVENNHPILLENYSKSKYTPGLLKRILCGN
jgi:WD40 repeat protein